MRDSAGLAQVLPTLAPVRREGYGFRVVRYKYLAAPAQNALHPHRVLYDLGAPASGARFTPRGGPPMLYLADDAETAFAEANPVHAAVQRQNPALAPPTPVGVYVSLHYRLEAVLDLTDPATQAVLGTDPAELAAPWRLAQNAGRTPPTQRLGGAASTSGRFQALLYESVRLPGHACFAVFTGRLAPPSFVEVYDPDGNFRERLP